MRESLRTALKRRGTILQPTQGIVEIKRISVRHYRFQQIAAHAEVAMKFFFIFISIKRQVIRDPPVLW